MRHAVLFCAVASPWPLLAQSSKQTEAFRELSGTKAAWLTFSVATAVGCNPKQLILAVGQIASLFRAMVPSWPA